MVAIRKASRLICVAIGLLVAASPSLPRSSPAETPSVISEWNTIAMTTLQGDTGKAPQESLIYTAFVQAAMYNAVVGVHQRYEPYRSHERAPRGTSATAAAASAAHFILQTCSPYAQASLDASLAATLGRIPDGTAKTKGVAFGERVARNFVEQRAGDGRYAPVAYTKAPAPGVWRPTPPANLPMAVPWLGGVTPLLVRSNQQFAPPPPPSLTSRRYTAEFAEVKALGSATSTARTPEQTATALFFSGNAAVQVNAALRDQAAKRGLDIVDAARMFAAVNMTVLDALITTWQAKLVWAYWRPITAIQLADSDGNPATAPDPAWTPLLVTPNYPDYVGGYNAVIASASRALEHVVGSHLDLTLTSTAVPGETRHYDSGRQLRSDVVDARILLGIHFRTADVEARTLGVDVADYASRHYFQR
jgi:hypothetical protein